MIDARNIYRKVTRKIYDFSPEQLQNLTAIVWLYRGQSDRFIALVQQHLERTLKEAAAIAGKAAAFRQSYDALLDAAAPFLKTLLSKPRSSRGNEAQPGKDQSLLTSAATSSKEAEASLRELVKEGDDSAKSCSAALDKWTARIAKDWKKPSHLPPPVEESRGEGERLPLMKKLLAELDDLATACRDLIKDVDLVSNSRPASWTRWAHNAGASSPRPSPLLQAGEREKKRHRPSARRNSLALRGTSGERAGERGSLNSTAALSAGS